MPAERQHAVAWPADGVRLLDAKLGGAPRLRIALWAQGLRQACSPDRHRKSSNGRTTPLDRRRAALLLDLISRSDEITWRTPAWAFDALLTR